MVSGHQSRGKEQWRGRGPLYVAWLPAWPPSWTLGLAPRPGHRAWLPGLLAYMGSGGNGLLASAPLGPALAWGRGAQAACGWMPSPGLGTWHPSCPWVDAALPWSTPLALGSRVAPGPDRGVSRLLAWAEDCELAGLPLSQLPWPVPGISLEPGPGHWEMVHHASLSGPRPPPSVLLRAAGERRGACCPALPARSAPQLLALLPLGGGQDDPSWAHLMSGALAVGAEDGVPGLGVRAC